MKRIRSDRNHSNTAEKLRFDLNDESTQPTDPFQVPEDYFDELPARIMDRITVDSQQKLENPQASPLLRKIWLATAAIAAIAVFFMMIKPANEIPATKSPSVNSSIAASITADYDQTYADEALLLEENEITEKDVASIDYKTMGIALSNSDTTSVSTDEIILYLLDENCDTDLLAGL